MQRPAVSVVVPTLDEERTIAGCLEAIGDEPQVEVVVSDGGSRDRTLEVARGARAGVRLVAGSPGRGQQLNRGAAAATAPTLLFVHADCRLPAGWRPALERALGLPGATLACFRLQTRPTAPGGGSRRRAWLRLLDLRSRGPWLPYGDQGFGLARAVFVAVGGFPEIPLMEDVALARACRRRGRIVRIPLAVVTGARRFERHPIRTRLMTILFPTLFRLGVSPWRLARWYRQVR